MCTKGDSVAIADVAFTVFVRQNSEVVPVACGVATKRAPAIVIDLEVLAVVVVESDDVSIFEAVRLHRSSQNNARVTRLRTRDRARRLGGTGNEAEE